MTRREVLNIGGFGGTSSTEMMDVVKFTLTPVEGKTREKMHIEAHVKCGSICSPLDPLDFELESVPHLQDLTLADPVPRKHARVDLLLGSRYYFQLLNGRVIGPRVAETGPLAIDSPFGWVLAGPIHKSTLALHRKTSSKCMLLTATDIAKHEDKLDGLMQNFWKQEAIGLIDSDCVYTHDDRSAVSQFEKSVQYDGERYHVALPFRGDSPELCSNYYEAKMHLCSTEKSLRKNSERMKSYDNAIADYVNNGFARELTEQELIDLHDKAKYFIPHHPVFKDTSSSTKIRIVFDASSKDSNGNSLNDCLLKGPNLLPDIAAVLLRFRMHRVALNGDLQKMFCQTAVIKDHQRYQLYLWRNCDTAIEPKVYAMERLMFGVSSSPFLAIQSVLEHARSPAILSRFGMSLYELLKDNMYMDDVHIGGETIDEVLQLQKNLVEFFKSGGWTLIKFASNSAEVLNEIPENAQLPNMVLSFDNSEFGEASSLGLKWDTVDDVFYCKMSPKLLHFDKVVTKRSILSKVSQIYDLFGFLAAYTIRAKILIQKLWKKNVGWNEELHCDIARDYNQWVAELVDIETVKIPRCPFAQLPSVTEIELHGFCDSSSYAYAAIVYLKFTDANGQVQVSYVMAKTRVAPIKQTSIPRLELMAAHSLVKLANYVLNAVKTVLPIERVYLWTDSKIVLAWISKPSYHWKLFVKNRVQEIHDYFSADVWRHCPGLQNPADLHSRGMRLNELLNSDIYWHGPEWLLLPEYNWPSTSDLDYDHAAVDCLKEVAKCNAVVAVDQKFFGRDLFEHFSEYVKIVRVIARILRWRFFKDKRCADTSQPTFIGPNEFKRAENFLFSIVQRNNFAADYKSLLEKNAVTKDCVFKNMDPCFDAVTKLIIGGDRLKLSNLPDMTKHPIILPDNDPLVEKLIMHVHVKNNHATQDTTIALLRERFHIIHFRKEVRKVCQKCIVCKHFVTQPLHQKMGILPEERVTPAPAFFDIGLDFTGPVYLKRDDEGMRKSYICVFTCMHSRAVHFELTNDMTTEEFLNALKRFINRRGLCHSIVSDNQSTFKKANQALRVSISEYCGKKFYDEAVQCYFTENGIRWSFIAERSPHGGGFYERLNRSLKDPLKRVLRKAKLNYSEMYTLLTDIECTLNQRPLTYLGSDPNNLQALTPSHLMIGRPLRQLPLFSVTKNLSLSKRFMYLQTLLKHFWSRWTREYLPTLARRSKWTDVVSVPKVGDVCLITEEKTPRPTWPLGRVVEAIVGKDGLVRTYKLQTKSGIVTRPVQRLHLLEAADCE